jgi:hypothetical protein
MAFIYTMTSPPREAQFRCLRPQLSAYVPSTYHIHRRSMTSHSHSHPHSPAYTHSYLLSSEPKLIEYCHNSSFQSCNIFNLIVPVTSCRSPRPPGLPRPRYLRDGKRSMTIDTRLGMYLSILTKSKILTISQVLCGPCNGQIAMGPP